LPRRGALPGRFRFFFPSAGASAVASPPAGTVGDDAPAVAAGAAAGAGDCSGVVGGAGALAAGAASVWASLRLAISAPVGGGVAGATQPLPPGLTPGGAGDCYRLRRSCGRGNPAGRVYPATVIPMLRAVP